MRKKENKVYERYPIAFASVKNEGKIKERIEFFSKKFENLPTIEIKDKLLDIMQPCWKPSTYEENKPIIPIDTLYRINIVYRIVCELGFQNEKKNLNDSFLLDHNNIWGDIFMGYDNKEIEIFFAFKVCVDAHIMTIIQNIKKRYDNNEKINCFFETARNMHHKVIQSGIPLGVLYWLFRDLITLNIKPKNYEVPYKSFKRICFDESKERQRLLCLGPTGLKVEDYRKLADFTTSLVYFDFEKVESYYQSSKLTELQRIKECSICGNLFYANTCRYENLSFCGIHSKAEIRAFQRIRL